MSHDEPLQTPRLMLTRRVLLTIGLSLSMLLVAIGPVPSVHGSTTWSGPTAVFTDTIPPFGLDTLPTALQASNGQLWMAWQTNRISTVNRFDIFYETMTNGVWSSMTALTSSNDNQAPNLVQMSNGTILLLWAWASNPYGSYHIYDERNNGGTWSAMTQVTSGANDTLPSATVGSDGALWLFWVRITASCTITPCRQIYYKTLRNGVWSSETQLTTDATYNVEPSAMFAKDGRLWLVFAKWEASPQNYQLFYKVYNGTLWGADTILTGNNVWDARPSVVQDRNGTIWVFFENEIQISPGVFVGNIYNFNSVNNGVTWSNPNQMTFNIPGYEIDYTQPSAVQGQDKSLWVFFSSDLTGLGADYDIYYLRSNPIYPVHDITVSAVSSSPSTLYPGGLKSVGQSPLVSVNVIVTDLGDFAEAFQASVTAVNTTSYAIGSLGAAVGIGQSITLSFVWNTTNMVKPSWYRMMATVTPVPGQTVGNTGHNTLLSGLLVHILPLGDIDQDGNINFVDASVVAFAYGSSAGSPRWNPYADINGSGVVDFSDFSVMAFNYGIVT